MPATGGDVWPETPSESKSHHAGCDGRAERQKGARRARKAQSPREHCWHLLGAQSPAEGAGLRGRFDGEDEPICVQEQGQTPPSSEPRLYSAKRQIQASWSRGCK